MYVVVLFLCHIIWQYDIELKFFAVLPIPIIIAKSIRDVVSISSSTAVNQYVVYVMVFDKDDTLILFAILSIVNP